MKSLAKFNLIFVHNDGLWAVYGSHFKVEGTKTTIFPSAMIRRNFPQAKTFTRLEVNFHKFEIDKGRTLWLKCDPYGELTYTFSRRGKVINSELPVSAQIFLRKTLHIRKNLTLKIKMAVDNI